MTPVFGHYARYYDLLYRDKNYAAEVEFIHQLIQQYAPATTSILELGCGTGVHASLLAEKGYHLCGVDFSEVMLEQAHDRLTHLPPAQAERLQFLPGDIRTVRVEQRFDVVISLFHVISYQITNEDLAAAFATAKAHLKPGGVLIFDCWYGPAVLSDRPTVRVKRLADDRISVTRIAEPVMYPNQNRVDVNYQILIHDRQSNTLEELREIHTMRYLFPPEIDMLFAQHGFEGIAMGEWMTHKEPGWHSWETYFVGRCLID
jgi:SAM-dependent methyltransferase